MRPVLMVVDDDPSVLLLVDVLAEKLGFRVKAVTSGLQALEQLPGALLAVDIFEQRPDAAGAGFGLSVVAAVAAAQIRTARADLGQSSLTISPKALVPERREIVFEQMALNRQMLFVEAFNLAIRQQIKAVPADMGKKRRHIQPAVVSAEITQPADAQVIALIQAAGGKFEQLIQLLLIQAGACRYDASHMGIRLADVKQAVV